MKTNRSSLFIGKQCVACNETASCHNYKQIARCCTGTLGDGTWKDGGVSQGQFMHTHLLPQLP